MCSLTVKEEIALESLKTAWECFLVLDNQHPQDRSEFLSAIHRAQNIIMSRPCYREMSKEDDVQIS